MRGGEKKGEGGMALSQMLHALREISAQMKIIRRYMLENM